MSYLISKLFKLNIYKIHLKTNFNATSFEDELRVSFFFSSKQLTVDHRANNFL